MNAKQLAAMIDHTNLKPFASVEDFKVLCQEASENQFKMVAINSSPVSLCADMLKETGVNVGAAISFPLGQTTIATKCFETEVAIKEGADEIDYVINIGELKNGNYAYIEEEMSRIVAICRENKVTSKVIFENCYLNDSEKIKLCQIASEVKPDFIKTSTGLGTSGATVEDIKLMRQHVAPQVKVKASGGVRDLETFLAMVDAGAERIGTSSSLKILKELAQQA